MRPMVWVMVFGVMSGVVPAVHAASWERMTVGADETAFVALAAHPADPARLFAASERALYESLDGGAAWETRFLFPAGATPRYVAVSASEAPAVLVATDQGLYGSFDGGESWSRVFQDTGPGGSECTVVLFHPSWQDAVLLGTHRGLYISSDAGRSWAAVRIPEAARDILHAAIDPEQPERIYLVTTAGLFTGSLTQGDWQQRVSVIDAEEPEVDEPGRLETLEADEENGSLHRLSAVAVDPQQPGTVYAGGSRGLLVSQDHGVTWQPLAGSLPSREISHVILQRHSPLAIYAATDRGVASYQPERDQWTLLVEGLATTRILGLSATPGALWAATDQGLYRYATGPEPFPEPEPPSPRELLSNFGHEPSIGQVREAAIRYAEVYPEKILRWRRQAALRALLPQVDVGWDHDRSRDAHYDEGSFPNFQVIETEDRNAGFDFSITWELSDLIWSTNQTSIDVRSKLMVELRDDIVDQVIRSYFERRRMQVALLTDPPADPQKLMEKELRVQELTAVLDGLTGGYFSKQTTIH